MIPDIHYVQIDNVVLNYALSLKVSYKIHIHKSSAHEFFCVAADISNCKPPIHILIAWIGDDICDVDLNNPDCDHDGGDCDNWTPSTTQPDTSTLPPNCDPPYDAMLLWIGK